MEIQSQQDKDLAGGIFDQLQERDAPRDTSQGTFRQMYCKVVRSQQPSWSSQLSNPCASPALANMWHDASCRSLQSPPFPFVNGGCSDLDSVCQEGGKQPKPNEYFIVWI